MQNKQFELTDAMQYFKNRPLLVMAVVVTLTLIAMHNTLFLGWVDWDDKAHIIDNLLVRDLSWSGIKRIFLTPELNGSYVPLPMLTWALNYYAAGLDPFWYHLVNLILHLTTTAFVFVFFKRLSSSIGIGFLTALLFGIHPMHVEPVAWITGRKDVLYALFFMSSLTVYLSYAQSEARKTPLLAFSFFLFLLSLLSKGVAVVLPIILLMIDFYVGRRFDFKSIVEKVPFFILSLVFGLVAVFAQEKTVALESIQSIPFHISAITSSYSLSLYLIQAIFPFQIGAFHPYPPTEESLPTHMLLSVITPILMVVLLWVFRRQKNILFGLGFALISFLPVIQLIPVGGAMVSDRYTYIPYLGIFFLFSWIVVRIYKQLDAYNFRIAMIVVATTYMAWLGYEAHCATNIWKNSLNLWTNVIEQHPHDSKGYINRGRYYFDNDALALARSDYKKALEIDSQLPVVYQHLGLYYQKMQQQDSALEAFSEAVRLDSTYFPAWLNMGVSYMHLQQFDSALNYLTQLQGLDTSNILVHVNKGVIYEQLEDFDSAIKEYANAIEKQPTDFKGYQYRAVVLFRVGRYRDALGDAENWIIRSPRDGKAYLWRSRIEFMLGDFLTAESDAGKAASLGTEVSNEYLTMITDSLNYNR